MLKRESAGRGRLLLFVFPEGMGFGRFCVRNPGEFEKIRQKIIKERIEKDKYFHGKSKAILVL